MASNRSLPAFNIAHYIKKFKSAVLSRWCQKTEEQNLFILNIQRWVHTPSALRLILSGRLSFASGDLK